MQLTLQISNADENLLKALKGVVNLYPQAKLKVKKEQDATSDNYTKEFEEEILQDLQEINRQRKAKTLKIYDSVKEAFKNEGLI